MRIASISARPPRSEDVAAALSGATALLGQRPAVTGLGPDGRREQGFASLGGWVAKGANLLTVELGLGPGARVAVAGPPGWPLTAIVLATWWIGATVVPIGRGADLSVLHVATTDPGPPGDVLWFGDELDGTAPAGSERGEQWTEAVVPHADRPPAPCGDGDLIALADVPTGAPTQRELLDAFADDPGGVLGIVRDGSTDVVAGPDVTMLLGALALRPLVTGSATVIVGRDDPERAAHATAERVVRWVG